ncbi:MAG: glucosylglycerol hydrolase, partial [Thainema sp.]
MIVPCPFRNRYNFPGKPIQVICDVVYGHADNQALDLLNGCFFKSPGMYGQEIEHQNPTVRAILLEMQRRKMNTGADALRIDGGQDFQFFNPLSGQVEYDDEYLKAMSDIPQTINEYQRYPFPIYEDGRPWPNPGWEEVSTYRDVLEYLPDTVQWGPLVFAHNKPTVQNFWDKKWRRVKEVMEMGSHWITGCGNHDTMHRGSWVAPDGDINRYLGETLPEIFRQGYDNPAITMWVYGFSPGIPMDFINCTMRAPWTFFRNTDKRYGIKIIAKEERFIDWQIDPELYQRSDAFPRLKAKGFATVQQLSEFVDVLAQAVEQTNYDLQEIADRCRSHFNGAESANEQSPNHAENVAWLEDFGTAYMEDVRDISSIWKHEARLDPQQTAYNRALREFRLQRDWLRADLLEGDLFDRISDEERTLFYGIRTQPSKSAKTKLPQQVAMVTHMGGTPITVNLEKLLGIDAEEWRVTMGSTSSAGKRIKAELVVQV